MRTYFQDFVRDNGLPVTVEYSSTGGEPNFDYPGHICDGGGSGPEIVILKAWPDTPWHNRLASIEFAFQVPKSSTTSVGVWLGRKLAAPFRWLMAVDEWWRASLSDAERERMEAWLAERYEDDYSDDYY